MVKPVEAKEIDEMNTDELIAHCKKLHQICPWDSNHREKELIKRLEIAMDILLHDSQQQSNH